MKYGSLDIVRSFVTSICWLRVFATSSGKFVPQQHSVGNSIFFFYAVDLIPGIVTRPGRPTPPHPSPTPANVHHACIIAATTVAAELVLIALADDF